MTTLPDGLLYTPPEGMQFAAIRVQEHVRPLEPLRKLSEAASKRLSLIAKDLSIEPPEPLVTFEAEGAATISAAGVHARDGKPIEFQIGFVFGDDFYDRIDAYCTDPRQSRNFRTSLRGFVLEYRLGLGSPRARQFQYTPPRGWQGRGRALRAQWYPADYPRHASRICITPAVPCQSSFSEIEQSLLAQLGLHGFVLGKRWPTQRLNSPNGLNGILYRMSGTAGGPEPIETEILTAVLLDERYAYFLRLETVPQHVERDRALLLEVVQSAHPVPTPVAGQSELLMRGLLTPKP